MIPINQNRIFINLVINMALVIIGYALAVATRLQSNLIFQPLKILFLLYSMSYLLEIYNRGSTFRRLLVFTFLILSTIPFSVAPIASVIRLLTFVVPFIYVSASLKYLFIHYEWDIILASILKSFRWIYSIPAFSYLIFGGSIGNQGFYGETVGVFISNHYGWAAFMFISSHLILLHFNLAKIKSIWSIIAIYNLIILFLSGSRSGLLSLIISLALWYIASKGRYIWKVTGGIVLFVLLGFYLSSNVILDRYEKTITQIESGQENTEDDYYNNTVDHVDARASARKVANLTFIDNPVLFATGMGIFQFKAGLEKYSSWADPYLYATGVHNSYGELFYGSGILVFFYFLWHFTIIPLKVYILNFSRSFFSFIGIILIPFFESNLTGGQFLFYPWFISIFFLLHYKEYFELRRKSDDLISE